MALRLDRVTLAITPTAVACPPAGGTFTATVTVAGRGTTPGTYNVEIKDIGAGVDVLDRLQNVAVAGGSQLFSNTHTFTLSCDDICEVTGRLGSSGNQRATIRADVEENDGNNSTKNSISVRITCGSGSYKPRGNKDDGRQR